MRILLFMLLSICLKSFSQSPDEIAIRKILNDQTKYWNQGNIDKFIVGYWKNDSLMFIGKSGITYGYTNTLNNYKKNYSDTTQMGKLAFE